MNSIDKIIASAVFRDEDSSSTQMGNGLYLVGTGPWKCFEDDKGLWIIFTDVFSEDAPVTVFVPPNCDIHYGDTMVLFTEVFLGDKDYSLVLFLSRRVD